ncbi:MAG: hypothetical protein GY928_39600 [Colwellia sp.]|nr:hypothetical protein [Colwellia sp.]
MQDNPIENVSKKFGQIILVGAFGFGSGTIGVIANSELMASRLHEIEDRIDREIAHIQRIADLNHEFIGVRINNHTHTNRQNEVK